MYDTGGAGGGRGLEDSLWCDHCWSRELESKSDGYEKKKDKNTKVAKKKSIEEIESQPPPDRGTQRDLPETKAIPEAYHANTKQSFPQISNTPIVG